jgi:hypothetical protein
MKVSVQYLDCLILPMLVLSACGQPATDDGKPTPTRAHSQTEIPLAQSARPSPVPQTRSPIPTETLDETAVFEATGMARYTTRVAPFLGACDNTTEISQNMSPDGEWTFCGDLAVIVIGRQGKELDFSYRDYLDTPDLGALGFTHGVYWTKDDRYFYFAPMAFIDAIDPLPYNAMALFRMDLADGEVATILPGTLDPHTERFYVVSISPTGRRLAYSYAASLSKIHIRDLINGEEKTLSIVPPYDYIGDFSWSEDGLLLTLRAGNNSDHVYYYLTYNVLDLSFVDSRIRP